jgi:hypothetical protein
MGCPFTNIYNLAQVTIVSYKIEKLKGISYEAFSEYMRAMLTVSIPEFKGCLQSLTYYSEEVEQNDEIKLEWYFDNDLTLMEQAILAKIVVYKWWTSAVQEVTAFQPKLAYREFKQLGTEQNLKQKSEYKDKLREEFYQDISDYQLANLGSIPFFGGN